MSTKHCWQPEQHSDMTGENEINEITAFFQFGSVLKKEKKKKKKLQIVMHKRER